ncbi:MAG: hypothetical protein WAL87_09930 [Chthoniobacterales bacterium]
MKLTTSTKTMSNLPTNFEVKGPAGTQHLPEVKAPEPTNTKETGTRTHEPPPEDISNG